MSSEVIWLNDGPYEISHVRMLQLHHKMYSGEGRKDVYTCNTVNSEHEIDFAYLR
jgi:hypothetical protein